MDIFIDEWSGSYGLYVTYLAFVVGILRIRFESYLGRTDGTLNVETKFLNAHVRISLDVLLLGVELLALLGNKVSLEY